MEKTTVLVTAIGSFSADCVIRELKSMGHRVIGTDIYEKNWIPASKDVDRFVQVPLSSEEEKYIEVLTALCREEGVRYLFPLTDLEVDALNRHRRVFEAAGVCLCMSGEEEIILLRDKLELSLKVGGILNGIADPELKGNVRIIPSRRADDIDFENVTYPLILKPVNGRSSSGLYRIFQEDQLGFAFSNICDPDKLNDTALENYIVQPLIKGHVVTVDVLRDSKGHCTAVPREELLRTPNGAGLSVRVFQDSALTEACRQIAAGLNILGCVNFEFIRGEGSGVYYFIECNPRFSGGVAFTELAGVPMVSGALRCFAGEEIREDVTPLCGYMTKKYVECRM